MCWMFSTIITTSFHRLLHLESISNLRPWVICLISLNRPISYKTANNSSNKKSWGAISLIITAKWGELLLAWKRTDSKVVIYKDTSQSEWLIWNYPVAESKYDLGVMQRSQNRDRKTGKWHRRRAERGRKEIKRRKKVTFQKGNLRKAFSPSKTKMGSEPLVKHK